MQENHTTLATRSLDRPRWLTSDEWPFDSQMVTIDSQDVHVIDEGQGPTLVFVEAGMWSFIWRDVISQLRGDFRCIAMDFPGAGLAGDATTRPTLAGYSQLLGQLLDTLGVKQCVLVAHDLGGSVALGLAAREPTRIDGLVITQTFGWPPDRPALRTMLRVMGSRPMTAFDTHTNFIPRYTTTNYGAGRHLTRAARRVFLGPTRRRRRRLTFHHLMRDAAHQPALITQVEQALHGALATQPVLTIFGEKQDPFGFAQHWRKLFPGAQQIVVADGHHFPMCDDPQLFANTVRAWYHSTHADRKPLQAASTDRANLGDR